MSLPAQSIDDEIDLNKIPASALNISSRMKLSWFLNPEQSLRSNQGIARDYRGLAEQMGFQYNDIKNFQRSEDPTLKIIESWSVASSHSIGLIVSYLENMDRYDVIEDISIQFKNDAISYLKATAKSKESPIQVAEVTSCPAENLNAITVSDIQTGEMSYYDAYVCYAEEDIDFVKKLANYLESNGLVLFIKGRDLLAGTSEPDAHTELIKERCKFVLIILSPAFLNTPECEWQISYAAGFAIEQRRRKLIPLLKSPCEIPEILRYITLIDFTKPGGEDWLMNKLVQSLRATSNSMFVTSAINKSLTRRHQEPCFPSSSNPIITFPPSLNHPQISPALTNPVEISSIPSSANTPSIASQSSHVSPTNERTHVKHKWYHNIRNIKEKLSLNSSSTQPSTTSTATSGFYSHSGFELDSSSDYKKRENFIEDTI